MNLIFSAFAVLDGHREGANANLGRAAYDRGIVVALASARAQNPDCAAALVTNAPVPEPYAAQLAAAGVEVLLCPFDAFRFPPDTPWALAFYKLCALRWVLDHTGYERYLLLDADTYTSARLPTSGARRTKPCCSIRSSTRPASRWPPPSAAITTGSRPRARPTA